MLNPILEVNISKYKKGRKCALFLFMKKRAFLKFRVLNELIIRNSYVLTFLSRLRKHFTKKFSFFRLLISIFCSKHNSQVVTLQLCG